MTNINRCYGKTVEKIELALKSLCSKRNTVGKEHGLIPGQLRKSVATALVKNGVPISFVSKVLGHKPLGNYEYSLHIDQHKPGSGSMCDDEQ